METDIELMRRSLRRDHGAFAELYDRHARAVSRYAYSLAGNPSDADDLVQETFMTAWRRLAEIRLAGDSLLPWLIVTCRNNAANLRRSRALRAHAPLEDADGVAIDDPISERMQRVEELDWVIQTVDGLSATDRRIVELCLYEGRDYREAASLVGLSVGVMTKRVQRIRSRLRNERAFREKEAST